jgi:hypothetical protein
MGVRQRRAGSNGRHRRDAVTSVDKPACLGKTFEGDVATLTRFARAFNPAAAEAVFCRREHAAILSTDHCRHAARNGRFCSDTLLPPRHICALPGAPLMFPHQKSGRGP